MTPVVVVAVVVDVIVIIIDVFIPVDVVVDVILVFLIFKDVTATAVVVAAVNCDRPSFEFSIQIFVLDERLNKQQQQQQQRPIQIGFKKNGDNKNGKRLSLSPSSDFKKAEYPIKIAQSCRLGFFDVEYQRYFFPGCPFSRAKVASLAWVGKPFQVFN